ncbi:MAG: ribosome-associated translation inhibitor RaiA [Nitrospiraceae bacterium]|nr:ribosome-associated translation inhibitor RaiA [Nitrospiraceae bacterium]
MNIIITGRHMEITPALKEYAEKRISKFEKYLANIQEAVVTFSVEKKYRHKVEVLIKVNGVMMQAESTTEEIYSAIDEVVDKLEKQLKKYKEKLSSYRKGENKEQDIPLQKIQDEIGSIIKRKQFDMKPMSPDEAVMQMDLMHKDFYVFTNELSGDINVVYRRKDGNFGLIEPAK